MTHTHYSCNYKGVGIWYDSIESVGLFYRKKSVYNLYRRHAHCQGKVAHAHIHKLCSVMCMTCMYMYMQAKIYKITDIQLKTKQIKKKHLCFLELYNVSLCWFGCNKLILWLWLTERDNVDYLEKLTNSLLQPLVESFEV